ncbi:hypothetical protein NKW43_01510 [Gluconobacter albidus]|uniref:hypothetical protein n=1 Tax=Gluconobacter albidus TaxID=318683 RepID=UPI00209C9825|nr:hypothetical protein [Gluconobacter albidus]MCP1272353.1 hypothetical protein [Gluconobacter albidus]
MKGPVFRLRTLWRGDGKKAPVFGTIADPAERFRAVADFYGVSGVEIERRTRVTAACFWLSFLPSLPLAVGSLTFALTEHIYSAALLCASCALACISQALKCGLANYQFRTRTLSSFRDYWRTDLLPRFRSDRS